VSDEAFPTRGHDDELLSDPPMLGQEGSLHGYRSGRRLRVILFASLALGIVSAILGVFWLSHAIQARKVTPAYHTTDADSVAAEDRTLHWSTEGPARLGLMRTPPGVLTIVLPDRIVRLADDSDHAQVKVLIERGETRSVRTLVGRVVVEPRPQQP